MVSRTRRRVIYVGPESVYHGLEGTLIESFEPETGAPIYRFQVDSDAVLPLRCDKEHVRDVDPPLRQ